MNAMIRLLDNRWQIQIHRQVDGRYCAAAKKPYAEKWSDVFELVGRDGGKYEPTTEEEVLNHGGPRMPHRIATGETPEAALSKLADQVFGLTALDVGGGA